MCIFCEIVAGNIPSCKIYEDDNFLAFMDIAPIARGHALVIPKQHVINVFDTPDNIACGMYKVVAKLSNLVKEAFEADGVNIIQNNGAAAGQEVFHSHIHIIPRYDGDNLNVAMPKRLSLNISDIANDAEKIISYKK